MRAMLFRQHGGPDVLEDAQVPDPVPAAGELLVRVKACALNRLDLWIRQGIPAYHVALPHISGCDVAGVVERLGPGVTHPTVGTRAELDAVTRLMAAGSLKPVVDTVFPLHEARAAQERMLSREVFGKLVLVP